MNYTRITNGLLTGNGSYADLKNCYFSDANLRMNGGTAFLYACTIACRKRFAINCVNGATVFIRETFGVGEGIYDENNDGYYGIIVAYGGRIIIGADLQFAGETPKRWLWARNTTIQCSTARYNEWKGTSPYLVCSSLLGDTYQYLHTVVVLVKLV